MPKHPPLTSDQLRVICDTNPTPAVKRWCGRSAGFEEASRRYDGIHIIDFDTVAHMFYTADQGMQTAA